MSRQSPILPSAGPWRPAVIVLVLALVAPRPAGAIENLIPTLEAWPNGVGRPQDPPVGTQPWNRESSRSVESLLPFLADLVRRSGSGLLDVERAAFLVQDDAGGLRCDLWPFDNGHRRATFRGVVPSGTVAIAHTHPIHLPAPSEQDRSEAIRLGLRMYVATPRSVFEITPEGQVRALVSKRPWMEDAVEVATCGKADV